MTKIVSVERYNMWKILGIVIVCVLLVVLVPTRFDENQTKENVTSVEEQIELIPFNTTVERDRTITLDAGGERNLSYAVDMGDTFTSSNDTREYLHQNVTLTLEKDITRCLDYSYIFRSEGIQVNDEVGEACFNNSRIETISLKELYVGDENDYDFIFTLKELPTETVDTPTTTTKREIVNVTEYRNVTTFVNATTEQVDNVTRRVNWIFGFRWWFLD